MEKKENASKLISSLVALSLATTLGVPTIALADTTENGEGNATANAQQQQAAEGATAGNGVQAAATSTAPVPQNENKAEAQSEAVAKIGGETYQTLTAAIEAASDGATVQLLQDISDVYGLEITKTVTLDLSGKTITSDNAKSAYNDKTWPNIIKVSGNGNLTITGNGKIVGPSGEAGKALDATALINVTGNNASIAILNGEITAGGVGDCGMYGVYINGGGTAEFGDGTGAGPTINTWFAAIGENFTTSPANITINGGSYTSQATPGENDWWHYFCAPLYLASSGDVSIKGGDFSGYYALSTRYKDAKQNLTIAGGTFTGSKDSLLVGTANGSKDSSKETNEKTIKISGGTFSKISSAVPYAVDGANLVVGADETLQKAITIPAGKTISIDLGKHKLSRSNSYALDVYGKLFVDNGIVELSSADSAKSAIWVNKTAQLEVGPDTTVTAPDNSFDIGYYDDCTTASVTVKGALTGGNGITMSGKISAEGTSNKLVLDGATIQADGHAIYQAGGAATSFTLNNSNITGVLTGIEVRAGNLTVNNCTITGGNSFNVSANGNGTTTDGAGIAIAQHTTKQPINVVVNGGTISGKYALYESNPQNNDADAISQVKLSIAGGTFVGDVYSQDIDGFITGGTFSSKPDARYIASGYEAVGSDAYTVQRISSSTPAPAPTTETTTTTNPDGTTTTTVTDKKTGESTSTTEGANGTTVVEKTDASGNTTTKVTVPEGAATNAGAPVEIPAAVEVTKGKEVSISAPAGTIVAIPAAADAGNVAVIVHADGTETVIPMSLVEGGKAIVKLDGDETVKIVDNAKDFSDVPADHWAAGNIDFASSHEIFKGIGNGDTYEPETALTRNMMMTVLARTDGADTSDSDPWYAKGQQWAVDNGVSNGLWGEDSITREQLVTMLFNYANKSGMDTSARADVSGMENADAVSDWALEAVQWAVAEGILKGVDNTDLAPQGLATRAQAAAFMQRYVKAALL